MMLHLVLVSFISSISIFVLQSLIFLFVLSDSIKFRLERLFNQAFSIILADITISSFKDLDSLEVK